MAVITAEQVRPGITGNYVVWKWSDVGVGDTCSPVNVAGYREFTVQSISTSWGDFAVGWQGTCDPDGSGFVNLTDALTNAALSQTGADAMDEVLQVPFQVKPVPSGSTGDGVDLFLYGRV